MKAYEKYESLVAEFANKITSNVDGAAVDLKSKVLGRSGQQHQIDVVVKLPDLVVLVECKQWSRKIWPSVVLALFGRLFDISQEHEALPSRDSHLRAAIATSRGFSVGAQRLANFFCIETWHVKSVSEAVIKLGGLIGVRMADDANYWKDGVESELKVVRPDDS